MSKIISVCGYGYTGSGAIIDLLKEYDDCQILGHEREFCFLYYPYGINSLKYNLCKNSARYMSSDTAIRDFYKHITAYSRISGWNKEFSLLIEKEIDSFITSLSAIKWNGYWLYDECELSKHHINYFFFRLKRRLCNTLNLHDVFLMTKREVNCLIMEEANYIDLSKVFIENLINSCGIVFDKNVVINQFYPANNIDEYLQYFPESKTIVVDKDPRDCFILAKTAAKQSTAWIPTDNVSDFIRYYRMLRKNRSNNSNVLYIRFEDLIYQYTETVNKIEQFLGINNHLMKNSYFDPQVSIVNTRLFERFLQFKDDIAQIEIELNEYLYEFSLYKDIEIEGMPFDK